MRKYSSKKNTTKILFIRRLIVVLIDNFTCNYDRYFEDILSLKIKTNYIKYLYTIDVKNELDYRKQLY